MKTFVIFFTVWIISGGSAAAAPPKACPPGSLDGELMNLRTEPPLPKEFAQAVERVVNSRKEGAWRLDETVVEPAAETLRDYHRLGLKRPPEYDASFNTPLYTRYNKEGDAVDGAPGLMKRSWKKGSFTTQAEKDVEIEFGSATHHTVTLSPVKAQGEGVFKSRGGASRNPIFEFEVSEKGVRKRKIFRPIDAPERGIHESRSYPSQAARTNLAAGKLNTAMRLGTSPNAQIARVNGQLGILTDYAPGVQAGSSWHNSQATNRKSLSNVLGFEFWIGQGDGNPTNFNVTRTGDITVYDYNGAFIPGLPFYMGGVKGHIGPALPERYTREFVNELREMTSERVQELVGRYLRPSELEGLMLRRDVIFKDLELRKARGEPAFFD